MNCLQRLCAYALCGLLLLSLAGCQPEHKVVATVNGANISEEQYFNRLQSVDHIIPQLDAGGQIIVFMIREELTHQLAKERKANITDEQVADYINVQLRNYPPVARSLETGRTNREDLARQIRSAMEQFAIGTDGAKASDAELQAAYNEQQEKLKFKTLYTVRLMQVPDEATGIEMLKDLVKDGNFQKAGEKMGLSPLDLINISKSDFLLADQYPNLSTELDKLKPNQFTPTPVQVQVRNPQAPTSPPQTGYVVAQLIKREPERMPSLKEVRVLLEREIVEKNHPDWQLHYNSVLSDFTTKSQIHINLKRYESLTDLFIKPIARNHSADMQNHPPIK